MDSPAALDQLTSLVRSRHAACGTTQVLAIDGRSGSGKSEFATVLRDQWGWPLLRLEPVYPGWRGLSEGIRRMADCLADLAVGEGHLLPQWDWHASAPAPARPVLPTPHLLVEGVGAGARALRPFLSGIVWVEAPDAVRRARVLDRDGPASEPWWDVWAEQEDDYLRADLPREHADIRIRTV